jgi:type II secretory pathway component PulC
LPSSALPIELLGVMVDTAEPSRSACLIRCTVPVERVRTVGLGQTFCDAAELREVRQDAVVITNLLTKRPELLAFPTTGSPASPQAPPGTPPAATAQPPASEQPPPPPPVVKTSPTGVTVDLPRASVQHYLANLPDLLNAASATPRYQDAAMGQRTIEGFVLDRIRQGSVVEQMGFQNGDVILELNGEPLDGLATVLRLFGQAQNMPQSTMTVLRNGQRLTFVFKRE